MAEARDLPPQGLVEQHLLGGVGEVVRPPDDMRNTVPVVVHHVGEDVEGLTGGAHDDEVVDLLPPHLVVAEHQVVK